MTTHCNAGGKLSSDISSLEDKFDRMQTVLDRIDDRSREDHEEIVRRESLEKRMVAAEDKIDDFIRIKHLGIGAWIILASILTTLAVFSDLLIDWIKVKLF